MTEATANFYEVVQKCFDRIAVQVDGEEHKKLHKPGVEGLHVFLEGCIDDASSADVDAELVSVDALKKVFEEKGWLEDLSFKQEDVLTLLEALGIPSESGEEMAIDIAELVNQIHDREASK